MIEVKVYDQTLEVCGHAGYAPVGQDIVCAAASMLLYSLRAGLESLDGVVGLQSAEKDGYACISAYKIPPEGKGMFEMAEAGYKLLAQTYPDHVAFASKP